MNIHHETYDKGLALLNKVHGGHTGMEIVNGLKEICPDLATIIIQFGFGELLSRKGLDLKIRQLALIATCIAIGNPMPQLKANIEAALNIGATQQEIIEIILQTTLYTGLASTVNAMFIAKEVFARNQNME